MNFKNVLLLYKRSAYNIYFKQSGSSLRIKKTNILRDELKRFKVQHDNHYATLKMAAKVLLERGVYFTETYRGRKIDYKPFDLIITIGGDGTFLEAAKKLTRQQIIVGVNSSPEHSVGRFCIANMKNLTKVLNQILDGKAQASKFHRLRIKLSSMEGHIDALNDLLICHKNPAMLCRYYLKVNKTVEEQRSSGIWISTPAGSSGAIHSAGGKKMEPHEKKSQYKPRELYRGLFKPYQLKGGILESSSVIEVTSLMRKGIIYIDGAHDSCDFDYGKKALIKLSPKPINTLIIP